MSGLKSRFFAQVLLLALAGLLAGCAGAGYVDPGPDPARVRVKLDLPTDRSAFNQFDDTTPYTSWDWGLWLEKDGRLVRLAPEPPQQLSVIRAPRLVRDTVFLAPPGRRAYRLIVNGYVGVRQGWTYWPINVVLVDDRQELDLAPGQEIAITPEKVLTGVAAQGRVTEHRK
ncbi:MAG: hypothetical protein K9K66_11310 [Desulfarculaceae bacterium]|nr:hypothetical protein [Desulfarculaceae bacterium]MCF8070798.1 hypothetical protein [Desulfarculaceae bacterium]MCF8102235.1 hypothetical protein [Desulfarculaceae bacterium]MCF8116966.1 hypothetical protein [Desulfarculaceae bacterium]